MYYCELFGSVSVNVGKYCNSGYWVEYDGFW